MKTKLLLPFLAALLGGCVNLHVYFPEAHDNTVADTPVQDPSVPDKPAPADPAGQSRSEAVK